MQDEIAAVLPGFVTGLRRAAAALFEGYDLTRHERDELASYVRQAADRLSAASSSPGETRELEARHETLRVAVMTAVSDPHASWQEQRAALTSALNKDFALASPHGPSSGEAESKP
jgi:hypothetical protein